MTDFHFLLIGLTLTVAFLLGVIATGLRAQRKRHLPLVLAFFLGLAFTIWMAERLGEGLDIEAAGWIAPVHLTIAKYTTLGYALPVITGVMTIRNPRWRPRHRIVAIVLIVATVVTLVTGAWMGLAAEPL